MSRRIIGIDPGLTRCGVGIVDVGARRDLEFVYVGVIETFPDQELSDRLLQLGDAVETLLDRFSPQTVSLERVFAEQRNLNTVMGVAQISGIVMREAAARKITTELHTPSEVKAAVTGYGRAEKSQVGQMVQRLLKLPEPPKPADAADALALAICEAWQTQLPKGRASRLHGSDVAAPPQANTRAQEAWLAAERAAKGRDRRLR